jgi:hypothetical protein
MDVPTYDVLEAQGDEAASTGLTIWDEAEPFPNRIYLYDRFEEIGYMEERVDLVLVLTVPFRVGETEQVLQSGTELHMEDE